MPKEPISSGRYSISDVAPINEGCVVSHVVLKNLEANFEFSEGIKFNDDAFICDMLIALEEAGIEVFYVFRDSCTFTCNDATVYTRILNGE